jgi:hypothetical protein
VQKPALYDAIRCNTIRVEASAAGALGTGLHHAWRRIAADRNGHWAAADRGEGDKTQGKDLAPGTGCHRCAHLSLSQLCRCFRLSAGGAGVVFTAAGMTMSETKTPAEDALFDRSPIHLLRGFQ